MQLNTCRGLGGAGRGGACLVFLGGSAGEGDSGLGGAPDLAGLKPGCEVVGACRIANGSLPKSSFPT